MNEIERAIGRLEGSVEAINQRLEAMHSDVKSAMAPHVCKHDEAIEHLKGRQRYLSGYGAAMMAVGAVVVSLLEAAIQWRK